MTDTPQVTRMAPGEAAAEPALQGSALHVSGTARRPVDILFVHGMASGGWMWPDRWLDEFTSHGYRCWSITLPGRPGGGSAATNAGALDRAFALAMQGRDPEAALSALMRAMPGAPLLDGPGLADFADAIAESLTRIDRPTAVVAHSLGGAALQKLLQGGTRPAGSVLMASVPPYGLWRASLQMALLNPALHAALRDFTLAGVTPDNHAVLRANFFPGGVSNAVFDDLVPQLTDESLRAMTEAMGLPPFAPLPGPRRDVMVLGGSEDRFVPLPDLWATAAWYGSLPTILPAAGHLMMQEPKTAPRAAAAIRDFLDTLA